jgi:hypothetical protein
VRWAGNAAGMVANKNVQAVGRKPEGRSPIEISRHIFEDNVKMTLKL